MFPAFKRASVGAQCFTSAVSSMTAPPLSTLAKTNSRAEKMPPWRGAGLRSWQSAVAPRGGENTVRTNIRRAPRLHLPRTVDALC